MADRFIINDSHHCTPLALLLRISIREVRFKSFRGLQIRSSRPWNSLGAKNACLFVVDAPCSFHFFQTSNLLFGLSLCKDRKLTVTIQGNIRSGLSCIRSGKSFFTQYFRSVPMFPGKGGAEAWGRNALYPPSTITWKNEK